MFMKKNTIRLFLLMVLLFSLFSFAAEALDPIGTLRSTGERLRVTKIWDGLVNTVGSMLYWYEAEVVPDPQSPDGYRLAYSDQYKYHRKFVDFILFFTLFTSISYLALSKWFKKAGAVVALAVSLGVALAIPIVTIVPKGGVSITMFFPFARNIIYIIVMMIFFFILTREGLLKDSKFVAFILAAMITYGAFAGFGLLTGEGFTGLPGARLLGGYMDKYLGDYKDLIEKGLNLECNADKLVDITDDKKNNEAIVKYMDARQTLDGAIPKIDKLLAQTTPPPTAAERQRLEDDKNRVNNVIKRIEDKKIAVINIKGDLKEYEQAVIKYSDALADPSKKADALTALRNAKGRLENLQNMLKECGMP